MNNTTILDSSAIVSLFVIEDSNHELAISISRNLHKHNISLILPGEIITETLNVIGKKIGRKQQLQIGSHLLNTDEFIIIESDEQIRGNAFSILPRTADSVSFTDCIVMAIADYYNTKCIFGFNHAFVTNGYTLAE